MPHNMAAAADGDGDAPIAAFAVTKGGVVIKHIFVNAPPSPRGGDGPAGGEDDDEDPAVTVGRHPDCHVLVDHPSISRFHLELRARRLHRRITVTDLRSGEPPRRAIRSPNSSRPRARCCARDRRAWLLHGTWVSGRRIPPHTPVDLAAGDTLRLGASKREYRLLWLSLREALEMDDAPYMPPLTEEKEEPHAYQEASSQLVASEQGESADMMAHQESSQQSLLEEIAFPVKFIPSAPPLPDIAHSFSVEEPWLSQIHENCEGVKEEMLVDKNPISESFGSLIIQEMPAALTNAGRPVQSDKQDTSNQVSKRSKLKSVKSLHIDTGRSRDRSSTLSYGFQKEDENEIHVSSQSCGMECTACIALFGISDYERAEQKEEMIAEDKGHMNPPDSITMEGSKRESNTENHAPQDFKDDAFSDKEIPQWNAATVNMESEPVSETLERSLSNEKMAPNKIAEGPELDSQICGNLFDNLNTEEIEEICQLDKENITPYVSGNIIMDSSHIGLKPTISQELMDSISPLNLDHDNFSENENCMLDSGNQMKPNEPVSENLSPLTPADRELQISKMEYMPISHLEFKDGILLDRENSVLAPGKYETISPVRQEDLSSDKENVTPASKVKPVVRRVLGSRMDNSVSSKNTSNKEKCNGLSAKSEKIHTVDHDVFYSDKENLTPASSRGMKASNCLPKNLIFDTDQDQEAFCSDKENMTPQSSAARKTRDTSENRARVESAITKKRHNSQESGRAGQGMKAWTMVANTDSLLDDESRKSIMLLKGIKGTHLFIPRIALLSFVFIPPTVIRELDSMKQREGLFRRSTKATSTLQWIEECMETESWWIHVQSSSEMFPVAPTPPATPSAQRIDEEIKVGGGSGSFNPIALFSPRSSELADLISPKPEDRVLDCALLLAKLRSDHNVVILSSSVALKIKAMAEGMVCEGAREFRESLMNPCSSRFMWAASVAQGSAWSCLDAAALAEDYYNSHYYYQQQQQQRARKQQRLEAGAAKGLKLILRHNSLYAQATDAAAAARTTLVSLASV
ncbi:hypothetical protein HU200_016908 [Digitaria exilis]|uniref:FHA domain-containing protein n=1 Tax=Digitaria exilis TaxID=1010633 RepID=A0A835F7Y5_9POAL|nr:hypothetical protein HU200_016908 [Digitaria exilis]